MREIERQKLFVALKEKQDMKKRKQEELDDKDVRAYREGRYVRRTVPAYVDEDEYEHADEDVIMGDDAGDY